MAQIAAAAEELRVYEPAAVNWRQRSEQTARVMVPWLGKTAPDLRTFAERCLNSTKRIRELWDRIAHIPGQEAVAEELRQLFEAQMLLVEKLAGDVISRVVARFLVSEFPGGALLENSRSDYPDLYLRTHDYTMLPRHTRSGEGYGASVKGQARRPARVPDGLELKTVESGGRVDCHYNHMGLHLAVVHSATDGNISIDDVKVAFLSPDDYRESGRNTAATTVKYSFSLQAFTSVLR